MISVIIPVYNAEKYIKRCLNSILDQTEVEVEIIVVDDGSTDNSRLIIKKYVENYSNIILISKKNEGVSSARNVGINIAKGEFIMFVDADDFILPTLCHDLLCNADKNTDIVVSGYNVINWRTYQCTSAQIMTTENMDKKQIFIELYKNHLSNAPFAKLYKNEIAKKNKFREDIRIGEDLIFNFDCFSCAENIKVLPFAEYNYVHTPTSAMFSFNRKLFDEQTNLYHISEDYIRQMGIYDELIDCIKTNYINDLLFCLEQLYNSTLCRSEKKRMALEYINKEEVKKMIKNVRNEQYISQLLITLIAYQQETIVYIIFQTKKLVKKILCK